MNNTESPKRKTVEQINESKSCCFQKVNEIDKSLARLLKKREDPKIQS